MSLGESGDVILVKVQNASIETVRALKNKFFPEYGEPTRSVAVLEMAQFCIALQEDPQFMKAVFFTIRPERPNEIVVSADHDFGVLPVHHFTQKSAERFLAQIRSPPSTDDPAKIVYVQVGTYNHNEINSLIHHFFPAFEDITPRGNSSWVSRNPVTRQQIVISYEPSSGDLAFTCSQSLFTAAGFTAEAAKEVLEVSEQEILVVPVSKHPSINDMVLLRKKFFPDFGSFEAVAGTNEQHSFGPGRCRLDFVPSNTSLLVRVPKHILEGSGFTVEAAQEFLAVRASVRDAASSPNQQVSITLSVAHSYEHAERLRAKFFSSSSEVLQKTNLGYSVTLGGEYGSTVVYFDRNASAPNVMIVRGTASVLTTLGFTKEAAESFLVWQTKQKQEELDVKMKVLFSGFPPIEDVQRIKDRFFSDFGPLTSFKDGEFSIGPKGERVEFESRFTTLTIKGPISVLLDHGVNPVSVRVFLDSSGQTGKKEEKPASVEKSTVTLAVPLSCSFGKGEVERLRKRFFSADYNEGTDKSVEMHSVTFYLRHSGEELPFPSTISLRYTPLKGECEVTGPKEIFEKAGFTKEAAEAFLRGAPEKKEEPGITRVELFVSCKELSARSKIIGAIADRFFPINFGHYGTGPNTSVLEVTPAFSTFHITFEFQETKLILSGPSTVFINRFDREEAERIAIFKGAVKVSQEPAKGEPSQERVTKTIRADGYFRIEQLMERFFPEFGLLNSQGVEWTQAHAFDSKGNEILFDPRGETLSITAPKSAFDAHGFNTKEAEEIMAQLILIREKKAAQQGSASTTTDNVLGTLLAKGVERNLSRHMERVTRRIRAHELDYHVANTLRLNFFPDFDRPVKEGRSFRSYSTLGAKVISFEFSMGELSITGPESVFTDSGFTEKKAESAIGWAPCSSSNPRGLGGKAQIVSLPEEKPKPKRVELPDDYEVDEAVVDLKRLPNYRDARAFMNRFFPEYKNAKSQYLRDRREKCVFTRGPDEEVYITLGGEQNPNLILIETTRCLFREHNCTAQIISDFFSTRIASEKPAGQVVAQAESAASKPVEDQGAKHRDELLAKGGWRQSRRPDRPGPNRDPRGRRHRY